MLHDLPNGDALGWVGGQHAAEERLAVCGHMQRLLEVSGHNAREHLLQADQVVAPVITPLGKWQDTCAGGTKHETAVRLKGKTCHHAVP